RHASLAVDEVVEPQQQRALRTDAVVDRLHRDIRGDRDVLDRGRAIASRAKEGTGRLEDLFAGLFGLALAPSFAPRLRHAGQSSIRAVFSVTGITFHSVDHTSSEATTHGSTDGNSTQ